jgi:hypothetical protein
MPGPGWVVTDSVGHQSHLPSPGGPGQGESLPTLVATSSPAPSRWSRPGPGVSCYWQWWVPSSPTPYRWSRLRPGCIPTARDGHPPHLPLPGGPGQGQGRLLLPAVVESLLTYPLQVIQARAGRIVATSPIPSKWSSLGKDELLLQWWPSSSRTPSN